MRIFSALKHYFYPAVRKASDVESQHKYKGILKTYLWRPNRVIIESPALNGKLEGATWVLFKRKTFTKLFVNVETDKGLKVVPTYVKTAQLQAIFRNKKPDGAKENMGAEARPGGALEPGFPGFKEKALATQSFFESFQELIDIEEMEEPLVGHITFCMENNQGSLLTDTLKRLLEEKKKSSAFDLVIMILKVYEMKSYAIPDDFQFSHIFDQLMQRIEQNKKGYDVNRLGMLARTEFGANHLLDHKEQLQQFFSLSLEFPVLLKELKGSLFRMEISKKKLSEDQQAHLFASLTFFLENKYSQDEYGGNPHSPEAALVDVFVIMEKMENIPDFMKAALFKRFNQLLVLELEPERRLNMDFQLMGWVNRRFPIETFTEENSLENLLSGLYPNLLKALLRREIRSGRSSNDDSLLLKYLDAYLKVADREERSQKEAILVEVMDRVQESYAHIKEDEDVQKRLGALKDALQIYLQGKQGENGPGVKELEELFTKYLTS
ncbi:MAG: hypothetical protein K0S07_783 [Chlamydiales bacterium]|jgi:hypothetical protein|nr:hypothetical protein [Chlamydiales bacterium]